MTKPEALSILLAHHDDGSLDVLRSQIKKLGHEVACSLDQASELVQCSRENTPDLIVTSMELKDGPAIDALLRVAETEPVPGIVVTERASLASVEKALQDHVFAFLVEPVTVDDLRPTIYLVQRRFEQFEALRAEVEDLKDALAARKSIERAKGIIMKRHDLDEDEAYRRLQKLASSKRRKLAEIADAILVSEDI